LAAELECELYDLRCRNVALNEVGRECNKLRDQLLAQEEKHQLELPLITNKTQDEARRRLGEVLRHNDGPNGASHGCVEVNKAKAELGYWIARAEVAEVKLKKLNTLADKIARDIFELGNNPTPCNRIQFMGGKYPIAEIPQGGLCESALAKFISESIEKHLTL
jgi:hypothetical protein